MTKPAYRGTDIEQEVEQIRNQAQDAQAAIAQIRGHAHRANNAIAVTVNARGRLESLQLTPQALRLGPDALAATIGDCIAEASQQAEDSARTVAERFKDNPRIREATTAISSLLTQPQTRRNPRLDDDRRFDEFSRDPLGHHRQ